MAHEPPGIIDAFTRPTVWTRGSERAPHKPLLVLLALGRWAGGDHTPVRFADVEGKLHDLLIEFGPTRRSYHPEFPFWHLQSDGVWQLTPTTAFPPRKGHAGPSAKQLRESVVTGSFTPPVRQALTRNPELAAVIAHRLLDAHFPPSLHDDILAAVGLDLGSQADVRRPRDPAFRDAVLRAYGFACAVCGLSLRLGNVPVGLEAAHIRWHSAGGPDEIANGLCLCSLHHKLFDRGVITLTDAADLLLVSADANGANLTEPLLRHHRQRVNRPNRRELVPAPDHVRWHHTQVFRGQARD
jgi:putative restriction endonuclease